MQCKCGGSTVARTAKNGAATLEYGECQGCGRVGGEMLYLGGQLVATGVQARQEYQSKAKRGSEA